MPDSAPPPFPLPTEEELAVIGRVRWHAMTPALRRSALTLLRDPDGREALLALWALERHEDVLAVLAALRASRTQPPAG